MKPMSVCSLGEPSVPLLLGRHHVARLQRVRQPRGLEHAEVVDVAHLQRTDHFSPLVLFLRTRAFDVVHEVRGPARDGFLVESLRLGAFDVVDIDVVADELGHHRLQRLEARQLVDRVQRVAVFALGLELRDGGLGAFDVVVAQVVVRLVQRLVQSPRPAGLDVVVLEAVALVLEDARLAVHDVAREQSPGLAQHAELVEADVLLAW